MQVQDSASAKLFQPTLRQTPSVLLLIVQSTAKWIKKAWNLPFTRVKIASQTRLPGHHRTQILSVDWRNDSKILIAIHFFHRQ
jgi:hypothetical protein